MTSVQVPVFRAPEGVPTRCHLWPFGEPVTRHTRCSVCGITRADAEGQPECITLADVMDVLRDTRDMVGAIRDETHNPGLCAECQREQCPPTAEDDYRWGQRIGERLAAEEAAEQDLVALADAEAARREREWELLSPRQLDWVTSGGILGNVPLTCEFCHDRAVWSTGGHSPRVACYDLRHIAMASSIGAEVPPEYTLAMFVQGSRALDGADPECPAHGSTRTNDAAEYAVPGCICDAINPSPF